MKPRKVPDASDVVVGLSIPKAALAAGIGENTFRQAIAEGRIRIAKIGRRSIVRVAELDRWLASREQ